MTLAPLVCLLGSVLATALDKPVTPAIPELVPAITRAEVEAHVRWLASDELAGRVTGTPECERAAAYLAEVLRAQGAQPAGDDGTFLQNVPLERQRFTAPPELAFVDASGARTALEFGRDFSAPSRPIAARKLRLVRVADASDMPREADAGVALFLDGSSTERKRWLADAGLGVGDGFGVVLAPGSKRPGAARDADSLTGQLRRAGAEGKRPESVLRVNAGALERLRSGDVHTIEISVRAEVEHVTSANVVARIPGRGPRDGSERAIVLSAHYDHIAHGHGPTKEGEDTIFNGADDDASGVAAVLEIAGALGRGGELDLDVVVLLATAEEIGLLGTDEYLDRPVVPLERTVLNLNFEMLGRPDAKVGGAGAAWLTGDELTNLGALLRDQGLRVVADPRPEQHFFQRSDNYAFVLRGVIGQTLSSYDMHADYHRPSDEADRIDFDHLTQCTVLGEKAVRIVAGKDVTLKWTGGKSPVAPR